jgi:hypothetical protein
MVMVMPLLKIFQLYSDDQFYSLMKLEYRVKVIDKLYHILLYRVNLDLRKFELITLEVIYADCIGSCKPNYHTITMTTAPHEYA